jgi:hypothetical protein
MTSAVLHTLRAEWRSTTLIDGNCRARALVALRALKVSTGRATTTGSHYLEDILAQGIRGSS